MKKPNRRISAVSAVATCAVIVLLSLANNQFNNTSTPSAWTSSPSSPSSPSSSISPVPPNPIFTTPSTVGEYTARIQRSILDKQLGISQFKLENQGEDRRKKGKQVAAMASQRGGDQEARRPGSTPTGPLTRAPSQPSRAYWQTQLKRSWQRPRLRQ
jgi:hypothetical protein